MGSSPFELKTEVTATNLPVPVAVGGYKAVAGDNGDLKGAVHEVPGLVPAAALNTQENAGTSLTVGTSAIITHSLAKRDAEADPALLYGAYGYAGYPYTHRAYSYDTMDTHMVVMHTMVKSEGLNSSGLSQK